MADQDLANDLSAKTMLFEHFIKAKVGSISWNAQYQQFKSWCFL